MSQLCDRSKIGIIRGGFGLSSDVHEKYLTKRRKDETPPPVTTSAPLTPAPTSTSLTGPTPFWYTSVGAQIKKVSAFLELHGNGRKGYRPSDIPTPPTDFTPRTPTEVLLLVAMLPDKRNVTGLQRTFDSWWDFIVPPPGFTKDRWEKLKSDPDYLCLVPGIDYTPGVYWVAFDPNAHQGKSPEDVLAQSAKTTLAHCEVLMAAAMFPDWVAGWDGVKLLFPNMSALQFYRAGPRVPFLDHWGDEDRRVRLVASSAVVAGVRWASPVVRKLRN